MKLPFGFGDSIAMSIARSMMLFVLIAISFSYCAAIFLQNPVGLDTLFVACFAGLTLWTIFRSTRYSWIVYREERMWRNLLETSVFFQQTADERTPAVDRAYQSDQFEIPTITTPRSSRFWSSLIRVAHQSVAACTAVCLGMLCVLIPAGDFNLWLIFAFMTSVGLQILLTTRVLPLANAWKPIQTSNPIDSLSFRDVGFHAYHQSLLKSLGFESLGYAERKTEKYERLMSKDRTVIAELGRVRFFRAGKPFGWQYFFKFTSYFDDSNRVMTNANEIAEQHNFRDPKIAKGLLRVALEQHVSNVTRHCQSADTRVIPFADKQAVDMIQCYQQTLDKVTALKEIEAKQKKWSWLPRWLHIPLRLPLALVPKQTHCGT